MMTINQSSTDTIKSALTALQSCHRGLLEVVLDASAASMALTGARAARARELLDQIGAAIAHCDRLATVVEGDLRADQTLAGGAVGPGSVFG
jgi:hypothetical protein